MADLEGLGQRVRTARLSRRLSQAGLAKRCGLARSSVANIETNRQGAPMDTLLRLAGALKVPVSALLGETPLPELLTPDEHAAVGRAGELYTFIATQVVGTGATRDEDLRELRAHIHGIQQMVMSQAAGRQHPGLYRLLGETLPDQSTEQS